jgi:hypothetical protein
MKVFDEILRESLSNDELICEGAMKTIIMYAKQYDQGSLPLKTCLGVIIKEAMNSKNAYEREFH